MVLILLACGWIQSICFDWRDTFTSIHRRIFERFIQARTQLYILCIISSANTFQFTSYSNWFFVAHFPFNFACSTLSAWILKKKFRRKKNQYQNANDDLNCENIDLKVCAFFKKKKMELLVDNMNSDAKYFPQICYGRSCLVALDDVATSIRFWL